MFGKKKSKGEKTVAILDIESGSVGAALARLSRNDAPKLFGETRVSIPLLHTRSVDVLAQEIEKAIQSALVNISEIAANVRGYETIASQGEIDRVAVFLSPPWAAMHLSGGGADYAEPMRRAAAENIVSTLGALPTTFHPFGVAAAHGTALIFGTDNPLVLCLVHSEVSELLSLSDRSLVGRSTVPAGFHTLVRTLVSHGGVSQSEAHSFMRLKNHGSTHMLYEPLVAAKKDLTSLFADALVEVAPQSGAGGIIVLAPEPTGDLLARSLAEHDSLTNIFPGGGVVRALRPEHATPYIAAHAKLPDTPLMLESLFIDAKLGGIY